MRVRPFMSVITITCHVYSSICSLIALAFQTHHSRTTQTVVGTRNYSVDFQDIRETYDDNVSINTRIVLLINYNVHLFGIRYFGHLIPNFNTIWISLVHE